MPRLHYFGMHALPLELSMIEVELIVCYVHFILHWKWILSSLGHHALKCAIGGPRIEYHTPLSHKHDKESDWCKHCLKCIAMPCFALCCCQNRFLQTKMAGRLNGVPTDQLLMAESSTNGRWPSEHGRWGFHLVSGDPQCPWSIPWDLCNFQKSRAGETEANLCMMVGFRTETSARALGPLPEAAFSA